MNQNETTAYVRRIQDGDPAAFGALYEATSRRIYFICIGFLKNEHDAKDAMQETYLTALRKLNSLRDAEKVQSWLEHIAVNKCKDFLKRNAPIPTEDEILEANIPPEEELVFSEAYISSSEKRQVVMEILRTRLSDLQYQTIMLYYFNELSVRKIAEVMECSEGAVKNRLSTARKNIKSGIEEYEKAHETKLHAGVPLLTLLLQEEAKSMKVPDIKGFLTSEAIRLAGRGALKTARTTGRTGVHMIQSKLIAGAAAAFIAIGGSGTAAMLYFRNQNQTTESNGLLGAIVETEAITETEPTEQKTLISTETTSEAFSETTEESTTAPTETTTLQMTSASATTSAPVTEPTATQTASPSTEPEPLAVTREMVIAGYRNVLEELCNFEDWEAYGVDLGGASYKKPFSIDYYLCDMTYNGIPELAVVCSRDMMTTVIFYYTFDEYGTRCLYSSFEPSYASGLMYDTEANQLVLSFGHFGIYDYRWLAYEDGKVITTKHENLSIIREDKAGTEDYYDDEYWEEWETERHLADNHFSYSVQFDMTTYWEKDANGEIQYTEIPGLDFAFLESWPF